MDKAIVERAVQALAALNGVRHPDYDSAQQHENLPSATAQVVPTAAKAAPCGSPNCAGCYEIGNGKKLHPPKCGENYREWLERWEARGRTQ
jgi:hypothetical protein